MLVLNVDVEVLFDLVEFWPLFAVGMVEEIVVIGIIGSFVLTFVLETLAVSKFTLLLGVFVLVVIVHVVEQTDKMGAVVTTAGDW